MAINVEDYSAHLTSMRSLFFLNIIYGAKEHKEWILPTLHFLRRP